MRLIAPRRCRDPEPDCPRRGHSDAGAQSWVHPPNREDPEEAPDGRPNSKRVLVWRPRSGSRSDESAGKDGGIDEDGGQKAGGARGGVRG